MVRSRRGWMAAWLSAMALGAVVLPGVAAAQSLTFGQGPWNHHDQRVLDRWLASTAAQSSDRKPLHPEVLELKRAIEANPELFMLFNEMFSQIPAKPEFSITPTGSKQPRDYLQALQMINEVLTTAPSFAKNDLIGFPINAILNWSMGTEAGSIAFLDPQVNSAIKKILNRWAAYLRSEASTSVLNTDPVTGWLGRDAMEAMPNFVEDFISDPSLPHYGFKSWDDFFTRQYRPGRRPVVEPTNNNVIANSCESAPYRLSRNVQLTDTFWVKAQPYSLLHIFKDEALANQFVGGTVYQGFLSALSYHRWHSPVSGTIRSTSVIDGSYYAAARSEGFDPASPNQSQGYLPQVASRGIVLIEADNPDIGLMAVVYVGMSEVSSNEFTVKPGQRVAKGDQLGMFHYGGSTHLLVFRPGVNLEFDFRDQTPGLDTHNIPVRSRIATVVPRS